MVAENRGEEGLSGVEDETVEAAVTGRPTERAGRIPPDQPHVGQVAGDSAEGPAQ